MPFTDIEILEIDTQLSKRRSDHEALFDIALRLSVPPPSEWNEIFNNLWAQEFYMMKRDAHVAGGHVVISCVPTELQAEHLPRLRSIARTSNETYRQILSNRERTQNEKAQAKADDHKILEELNRSLFK